MACGLLEGYSTWRHSRGGSFLVGRERNILDFRSTFSFLVVSIAPASTRHITALRRPQKGPKWAILRAVTWRRVGKRGCPFPSAEGCMRPRLNVIHTLSYPSLPKHLSGRYLYCGHLRVDGNGIPKGEEYCWG